MQVCSRNDLRCYASVWSIEDARFPWPGELWEPKKKDRGNPFGSPCSHICRKACRRTGRFWCSPIGACTLRGCLRILSNVDGIRLCGSISRAMFVLWMKRTFEVSLHWHQRKEPGGVARSSVSASETADCDVLCLRDGTQDTKRSGSS